jgi:hypothetical protein
VPPRDADMQTWKVRYLHAYVMLAGAYNRVKVLTSCKESLAHKIPKPDVMSTNSRQQYYNYLCLSIYGFLSPPVHYIYIYIYMERNINLFT